QVAFMRTNMFVPPPLSELGATIVLAVQCITRSFFFPLSVDPPHLHSFPTRRSSDLDPEHRSRAGSRRAALGRHPGGPALQGAHRSEEHTSELQSRFELVCRLLLEKKKQWPFAIYGHWRSCLRDGGSGVSA